MAEGVHSYSYDDDEYHQTAVMDVGSYSVKAGFAGQEAPRAVFPNITGRKYHNGVMYGEGQKDVYLGHEAQWRRGILKIRCPMDSNRAVSSWDDMERVWHHTFYNELRVAPEETNVLYTEPVNISNADKERACQIMFETFNIPCFYTMPTPVLSLLASDRSTGLVVDMGYKCIDIAVVHEESVLSDDSNRMRFIGGDIITKSLQHKLMERGYSFTTSPERDLVKDMMEKFSECALNVAGANITTNETTEGPEDVEYTLPDGQIITVGNERFHCTEVLFDPSMVEMQSEFQTAGLHAEIFKTIGQITDANIRSQLYSNIVLSGGPSMIKNLGERITKELENLLTDNIQPKVIAPEQRKYSAWKGGSMVTTLSTFEEKWITKDNYDEYGPTIIHYSDERIANLNGYSD